MAGATIAPPCVNQSEYLTSLSGNCIMVGYIHLKSLEQKVGKYIVEEREANGAYTSLSDFIERVPAGLEQVNILIKIGAFRFTSKTKRSLLWEARLHFNSPKEARHTRSLFSSECKPYTLPALDGHPFDDAFDELELLGFPLCDPFTLLPAETSRGIMAQQMKDYTGKTILMAGYLVTTKNTHTKDHKLMQFGTFIDAQGAFFDSTHFPDTCRKYPFRGKGFYHITGKVVEDFGYPMLEVSRMEKLPMVIRRQEILEGR